MLACCALTASSSAAAADRLEPGIRIVLADGTEILLEEEHLLMNRDEVASIAVLVRDLEACRQSLGACEREVREGTTEGLAPRRRWLLMMSVVAVSFAAGVLAADGVASDPFRRDVESLFGAR